MNRAMILLLKSGIILFVTHGNPPFFTGFASRIQALAGSENFDIDRRHTKYKGFDEVFRGF
jgi:hypothetical protein